MHYHEALHGSVIAHLSAVAVNLSVHASTVSLGNAVRKQFKERFCSV